MGCIVPRDAALNHLFICKKLEAPINVHDLQRLATSVFFSRVIKLKQLQITQDVPQGDKVRKKRLGLKRLYLFLANSVAFCVQDLLKDKLTGAPRQQWLLLRQGHFCLGGSAFVTVLL